MASAKELDLRLVDETFRSRFWSKVDIRDDDQCWPWKGQIGTHGYGVFTIRKGLYRTASRVSLAMAVGVLKKGEYALHHCDNPPCVNPRHLFVGSASDNQVDCMNKGRANQVFGEDAPSAKLTEDQVRYVLSQPEQFGMVARLSRELGISDTVIRRIRKRAIWSHLAISANEKRLCPQGHLLTPATEISKTRTSRHHCSICAEAYRVGRLSSSKREVA